ncbi:MAG: hypothetical protein ACRENL_07895 [Candidatus Dormibacteria bacterium]
MSDLAGSSEGDSELAEPVGGAPTPAAGPAAGDAEDDAADPRDDLAVSTRHRQRPNKAVLLLGALVVAVIAQVVMTWLVLAATTQLRDQSTIANGLQRCIIHAQLNVNSTTDPSGSAYKAAVQSCINR